MAIFIFHLLLPIANYNSSSWSSSFIYDNNENGFMNRNQRVSFFYRITCYLEARIWIEVLFSVSKANRVSIFDKICNFFTKTVLPIEQSFQIPCFHMPDSTLGFTSFLLFQKGKNNQNHVGRFIFP
jgi:hypothetical protein